MAILFQDIVFGPIRSRRLGSSLGVNLMPRQGKICTFDCIYCECGWNRDGTADRRIPGKEEVFGRMDARFREIHSEGTPVDTITFSGNGEPTLHPDFPEIIDYTVKMRDTYFPKAVISVLSNATMTGRKEIREALMKVDNPILKIDAVRDDIINAVNRPQGNYSLKETVENLKHFHGNFILQTIFFKYRPGEPGGFDLCDQSLAGEWIKTVLELRPREVMAYTLDRPTPQTGLEKSTVGEMTTVTAPLRAEGIPVQIRG